jgi:PAS domain S-box-containing protein
MIGVKVAANRLAWIGIGVAAGMALAALVSAPGSSFDHDIPSPAILFAAVVAGLSLIVLFRGSRAQRDAAGNRQDSEFLAAVLNHTADGIITIDRSGIVQMYNAAAERMFGYAPAEVIGNNVSMLLPSEERSKHDGYLKRSTLDQPTILGTRRTLLAHRKDGTSVPIEISVSRMQSDATTLFIGVCHDISPRLRAEEALRESEERLQDAIESMREGFAMFDADDRLLLCNTRYREMYDLIADVLAPGVTFPELLRIGAERGQFPEAKGNIDAWIADRMRQHHGPGVQIERQLSNGRWVKIEERQTRCGNIVGIRTDITELKVREQQLRESEERYRHLVDLLPDGVLVLVDGVIVFANDAMAKILGVKSRDNLLGRQELDFVPPGDREALLQRRREAILSRATETRETVNLRADGSRVDVERSRAVINWEGSIAYLMLVREITERKRVEKEIIAARYQAETANKVKSAFLANMSHELRTPLNAIIGFSDLMAQETFGPISPDQYRGYAGNIFDAGEHLLELINDILDLSKVEAGGEELQEEAIDIPELVQSAILLVQGRAAKGNVRLALDLQDDLPRLRGDLRKMKQILVNVVSNAVKFTEPGGSVTVCARCRPESGHVFQVADTGLGMAETDIPKALSPFGRIAKGVGRSIEGTGLGLPLTKKLVELHDGRLNLESALGVGTTVTLEFPPERVVTAASPAASGNPG